ncbi:MAG TPA: class I SAM-dependent methyltransferase [Steroidobacteraceae bacterium]
MASIQGGDFAGGAPPLSVLLDAASAPYQKVGPFAYHFARGKLSGDPAFRGILQRGLLRARTRILDLGCGQGLLTSWLRAARVLHESGSWPKLWPQAPAPHSIRGIELMDSDVERARRALGAGCGVSQGDIRHAAFGEADAVVILDVLHYMDDESQRDVLRRVRAALPPGGLLLLRIGDAGAGLPFHYSQWVDRTIMLLRGHSWVRTHCRAVSAWKLLLEEHAFDVEAVPMSEGTPFANVLLICHAR